MSEERPMTRLEAAARALWLLDGGCPYDELHPDEQADVMRDAKKVLDAAYPELTDGTHWIAPREATDAMIDAGRDVGPDAPYRVRETRLRWDAFRDAHLEEQDDIAAGLEALKELETATWDEVKDKLNLKDKPE